MKFWMYVVLRVLREVLIYCTAWIWAPLFCLLWLMFKAFEIMHAWLARVRKDWERRS